jgi:predicted nuclease of predicted toxin-antitoxin system
MPHGVQRKRKYRWLPDENPHRYEPTARMGGIFEKEGYEAVHWSKVGDFGATDTSILAWAKEHEYIVFTHDLDFGAILAASKGISPSVIQMRTQDTFPESCAEMILTALNQFKGELEKGALLSVDRYKARVRILPLKA